MADEAESADADATEEERENYPWVSQTPSTRIEGTPKSLIYAGRLDDSLKQNDTSFGLVLEDPEVVEGSIWVNQAKEDGGTTADGIDDDESRPTDYRVADLDDGRSTDTTEINGETFLTTGEVGPSSYEDADAIAEDEIILWYNGMSGQRLSRVLDFNGRPYAKWTGDDEPYLVKGLYQPADGWQDSGADRSQMAKNGKAPRVARAPILRQRVEVSHDDEGNVADATLLDDAAEQRILIDMDRFQGGRTYEINVFDADAYADAFGSVDAEIPRNDAGYVDDVDAQLDMPYTAAADDILEQAEYAMHMFTGPDFADEPSAWSPQSTAGVDSFGISADGGDDDPDGLTAAQEQFVTEVVDEIAGTGLTPDEAFEGGLEGLIGKFSDQFDRVPEADEVRDAVYSRTAHLDVASLEA